MPDGLLVIDKPTGWTSHDVVAKLRGALGERRVGHAGTLDPGATGVLLVGVGRFTRFLRYLSEQEKTYTCEIVFGTATSTLDDEGDVVEQFEMRIEPSDVATAAQKLTGAIEQVPPMVSAIKVDGRPLHQLAREGKEIERKPRPVVVSSFVTVSTDDPLVYRADVHCSSGTYVRSLGADLGALLGGGAHIRQLRRTHAGAFDIADAQPLEDALTQPKLLTPLQALSGRSVLNVTEEQALAIRQGKRLTRESDEDLVVAAYGEECIGVLVAKDGKWRPETVASY